jgi:hypothetical protein
MASISRPSITADGATHSSTSGTVEGVEKVPDETQQSNPQNTSLGGDAPDPNLVGWNGEDDPEKPLNWSGKKKWQNAGLIAAMTFLT